MMYLFPILPAILWPVANIEQQQGLFTAAIVASGLATIVFALWTRLPIVFAPGLVITSIVGIEMVQNRGIEFGEALGVAFYGAAFYALFAFLGLARKIVDAVPGELTMAIVSLVGLFLLLVGIVEGGILARDSVGMFFGYSFGEIDSLVLVGIALVFLLNAGKLPTWVKNCSMVLTVVIVTLVSLLTKAVQVPSELLTTPDFTPMMELFGTIEMNVMSNFSILTAFIVSIMFIILFDTIGVFFGTVPEALRNSKGVPEKLDESLRASSFLGSMSVFIFSVAPVIALFESAAGFASGGRGRLAGVVAGVFILLMLFIAPIVLMIPKAATMPLIVFIGVRIFSGAVKDMENDQTLWAFILSAVVLFVSFSITSSLMTLFVSYFILSWIKYNKQTGWLKAHATLATMAAVSAASLALQAISP